MDENLTKKHSTTSEKGKKSGSKAGAKDLTLTMFPEQATDEEIAGFLMEQMGWVKPEKPE